AYQQTYTKQLLIRIKTQAQCVSKTCLFLYAKLPEILLDHTCTHTDTERDSRPSTGLLNSKR
uniref:Uncharacterized protein n=1 Tax=Oryza brachyantha TaxID=4533 RepID=J3L0R9_ORYBR